MKSKSKFVYVTYIRSTQEKIWKALLESEFTRQYWGHENVSDWKRGSKWEHRAYDDPRTLRLVGEVIENIPNRRLVLTWADPADAKDKSKHSRVALETEPVKEMVRLTITHDELEEGSDMLKGIAEGWPRVLSSLKSLLETGRALDTWAGKKG